MIDTLPRLGRPRMYISQKWMIPVLGYSIFTTGSWPVRPCLTHCIPAAGDLHSLTGALARRADAPCTDGDATVQRNHNFNPCLQPSMLTVVESERKKNPLCSRSWDRNIQLQDRSILDVHGLHFLCSALRGRGGRIADKSPVLLGLLDELGLGPRIAITLSFGRASPHKLPSSSSCNLPEITQFPLGPGRRRPSAHS